MRSAGTTTLGDSRQHPVDFSEEFDLSVHNSGRQPIDLVHLRRYTLGDRGLEKEVLDLFLAQLPATIGALGPEGPRSERSRAAHTLKGSGRAVGAWQIAALAERVERLAQGDPGADLNALVTQIEAAIVDVRRFVSATYLAER
ncbi:MAG: Hpt domain-containing protein [Hyphomicrobium sp.]|nr:Hpt domain-containing protein [Hyphomicrobium sp.]